MIKNKEQENKYFQMVMFILVIDKQIEQRDRENTLDRRIFIRGISRIITCKDLEFTSRKLTIL